MTTTPMFDPAIKHAVKQLRLEAPDTRIVWLMCATLRGDPGGVTAAQLAELTGCHRSDVHAALDRLGQLGLVRRLDQHHPVAWHVTCSSRTSSSLDSDLMGEDPETDQNGSETDPEVQRHDSFPMQGTLHTLGGGVGEPFRMLNSPPHGTRTSPRQLMELWNTLVTHLPKVSMLDRSRYDKARRRLAAYRGCDWADVIRRLDASPFCQGDNSSGWRATFDFLLKPTTVPKTLEGVYDARPTPPLSSRNLAASEAWLAARRRARGESA